MNDVKKTRALILFRGIFATFLLISFFFYIKHTTIFVYPDLIYLLTSVVILLSFVYRLILSRIRKQYTLFLYFQIVVDVFFIMCLILITGGVESWFSLILLINIIVAAIMLGGNGGIIIASISSIIYGVAIELQYYGVIRVPYQESLHSEDFFYNIFANITALFLIAYLSRYLVLREQETSMVLQKTEKEFQDLYSIHKEVIESIPTGLYYTDIYGKIRLLNYSAEMITGITREDALEKRLKDIFPFVSLPVKKGRYSGVINFGKNKIIVDVSISEHKDSFDIKRGFVVTVQDITKITEMEREMKDKEKLAAIGELSANIAHEIRNPLAALKNSVEMLQEGAIQDDRKRRLMDIAIKEMERLNKIITDFLLYSSPKEPDMERMSLSAALNETAEMLGSIISEGSNIIIKCNFSDHVTIMGDKSKLTQVFWNLGLNAIQAMKKGGELRISITRGEGLLNIIFEDEGEGMAPEIVGKIFYPFFTTKNEGTGLGLALVYRIINDHNWKITVKSSVGKGTAFTITVPLESD